MRIYNTKFEIRSIDDETGVIEGLASATNVFIPGYNEKVMPGAFKRTLGRNKGRVPIFHMHSPYEWIGFATEGEEVDKGLMVKGQLNLDVQAGREQYSLIKQCHELGVPAGLSIGFISHKDNMVQDGNTEERQITELELLEWSPTPPGFQASPKSKVKKVRSLDQIEYELQHLNPAQVNDLIAHLRNGNHTPGDYDNDSGLEPILQALIGINTKLRT